MADGIAFKAADVRLDVVLELSAVLRDVDRIAEHHGVELRRGGRVRYVAYLHVGAVGAQRLADALRDLCTLPFDCVIGHQDARSSHGRNVAR